MKNLDIQVGDRLTFDNYDKEKTILLVITNNDQKFYERNFKDDYYNLTKIERIGSNGWYTVYEKEAEILDEVEKEYLSAVIKPFKDKVKFIEKGKYTSLSNSSENQYEFIFIRFRGDYEDIDFPKFKKNKMYKGMKLFHRYTLKGLGLE